MAKKLQIGKPPRGLTGDELQAWYEEAAETAAAEHYEGEMFKAREKRRVAEEALANVTTELDAAKAKLPGDDAILLKGDDLKRWNESKDLDIADLKAKAKAGETLQEEKRLGTITTALNLNPTTFTDFVITRGLKVETDKAGTADEQHVIVHKGDDGKEVRTEVLEFLTEQHAAWLPALVSDGKAPVLPPRATPTPLQAGRLPSSHKIGKTGDVQEEYLAKRQAEGAASRNVFQQKISGDSHGGKQ